MGRITASIRTLGLTFAVVGLVMLTGLVILPFLLVFLAIPLAASLWVSVLSLPPRLSTLVLWAGLALDAATIGLVVWGAVMVYQFFNRRLD